MPGSKDLNFPEPENDSGSKTTKNKTKQTNKQKTKTGLLGLERWLHGLVCLVPEEATKECQRPWDCS